MRTILLAVGTCFLIAGAAVAADCSDPACCDQAKSQDCCNKCGSSTVCKTVCEMKKVKKTVWVVECEEFCAPLPNCGRDCNRCCGGGKGDCGEASCDKGSCCEDPCDSLKRPMTPPKCGPVRCRKKLVKKEITCEVPVYKCVPVCGKGCCGPAAACGGDEAVPEATPAEAPKQAMDSAPLPPRVSGVGYVK